MRGEAGSLCVRQCTVPQGMNSYVMDVISQTKPMIKLNLEKKKTKLAT